MHAGQVIDEEQAVYMASLGRGTCRECGFVRLRRGQCGRCGTWALPRTVAAGDSIVASTFGPVDDHADSDMAYAQILLP
eukprot:10310909-Karenia_brevis.AAC.1